MPAMTKRVNINAKVAIRDVKPPIYGTLNNVVMSTGNILKCLCKRAIVDEILPDGSTVRLTMKNYYTDNGAGLTASPDPTKRKKATRISSKPEPKVEKETPKEPEVVKEEVVEKIKEPEIEATVVEETKVPTPVETEEKIDEEDKSNADRLEKKSSEEINNSSDEEAGEGSTTSSSAKRTNSKKRK